MATKLLSNNKNNTLYGQAHTRVQFVYPVHETIKTLRMILVYKLQHTEKKSIDLVTNDFRKITCLIKNKVNERGHCVKGCGCLAH